MIDKKSFLETLELLRATKPLVHNITNYVTVNDVANIILSIGASPVMSHEIKDIEELLTVVSNYKGALVLNIGTLDENINTSFLYAARKANALNIPVVLDPVGAGATSYRTSIAKRILGENNIEIVRGNMSEIKSLIDLESKTKGVDSVTDDDDGEILAIKAARQLGTVVAITGEKDFISDGKKCIEINNGVEYLSKVTGTGCMATALIGSFVGVVDAFAAAVYGILAMNLAGEYSYSSLKDEGVGTFRTRIFDFIEKLDKEMVDSAQIKYHGE